MNILQVIHGYPPHYMAGSEVYTWNLCKELARSHCVTIFTRIENPYRAPCQVTDSMEDGVAVRRVNKPARDYIFTDKYLDPEMDRAFRATMDEVRPQVVHFGHLSHLSSQLPTIAKGEYGVPVVFTLHDFWLGCPRGQLIRPDLTICPGPSAAGCLECMQVAFKGWIDLPKIEAYRRHMREMLDHVDVFLSPSRTLVRFFADLGVPHRKLRFSRYGFDHGRIAAVRSPRASGPLRVGFMGRVIPVKGIGLLLRAFCATNGAATLNVWGPAGGDLRWLEEMTGGDPRVVFRGAYHNGEIQQVLQDVDVMVVPSIWLENSPLVIQESFLAGRPVITSDAGGMAELVQDGVNGLLFPLGDEPGLRDLLQSLLDAPEQLTRLRPDRDSVRTIEDDAAACAALYEELQPVRRPPRLPMRPAPWRVTFVTNPGVCNLRCPMCDTHSPHAPARTVPSPQLDYALVERTVMELAAHGLREIIPSTMGEPLLYAHFMPLLELARRYGVRINLTTNGTFPGRGVDAWTAALLPVLSDVKFSVNSVDPELNSRIMGGIDSARQLENIRRYIELKHQHEQVGGRPTTATIQVTFMEANLDGLSGLLRWAIGQDLDRFKGHHIWVNWPQLREESLRRSAAGVERWNRMAARLHRIADEERRPDGSKIVLDNVTPLKAGEAGHEPADTLCPFLGREAWVEADGSFQVCCCPSTVRREFGDFGDLHQRSLLEIWRSPRYRDFVARWGDYPPCQACNMRRPLQDLNHA